MNNNVYCRQLLDSVIQFKFPRLSRICTKAKIWSNAIPDAKTEHMNMKIKLLLL